MKKSGLQQFSLACWLVCMFCAMDLRAEKSDSFVVIGTGGVAAVYYPAGGAICRMVNRSRETHGMRCLVESTGGSIDNIERLRSGDIQFGFAQSDWQNHAYRGTDRFSGRRFESLRAVFALHPEPFTVVARAETGIKRLDDLRGKRVNIGNPGSGQRATMEVVMTAKGWTLESFSEVAEYTSTDQSAALCSGEVDAIVMTVGHPSSSMQQATTVCNGVIVEVSGPEIDRLVNKHPYYRHAIIPGGMYNNRGDIRTFGVAATVVTSSAVSENIVYTVVESVVGGLDDFKTLHPALLRLKADEMPREGISVPLHSGAARYFRNVGLLEPEKP